MRKKDFLSSQYRVDFTDDDLDAGEVKNTKEESPTKLKLGFKRDGEKKKYHNRAEQARRSLLKKDFDKLRSIVGMPGGSKRMQTLTTTFLLKRTVQVIKSLETVELRVLETKQRLIRAQQQLKRRLEQLQYPHSVVAVSTGNTISLPNITPISNNIESTTQPSTIPHILKRKQILLSITSQEPQVFIRSIASSNIYQPENWCILLDDVERLEDISDCDQQTVDTSLISVTEDFEPEFEILESETVVQLVEPILI